MNKLNYILYNKRTAGFPEPHPEESKGYRTSSNKASMHVLIESVSFVEVLKIATR